MSNEESKNVFDPNRHIDVETMQKTQDYLRVLHGSDANLDTPKTLKEISEIPMSELVRKPEISPAVQAEEVFRQLSRRLMGAFLEIESVMTTAAQICVDFADVVNEAAKINSENEGDNSNG